MKKDCYTVKAKVWLYPGHAAWHFVSVDKKQSALIKETYGKSARGFGSVPVEVTIGDTTWHTSIFPSKRDEAYLLPLKREVRQKEGVDAGDTVSFLLCVR